MELDPLTIVLEIVNFLVLIWLLKRFLFKPVQAAIARRQQDLEQAQQDAQQKAKDATDRQQQLQSKIDDWEQEKIRQQQQLQEQLSRQREQAMDKVRQEAEDEKKRLQTILQQDQAALMEKTQQQAQQGAIQLTQQLLNRLAGTDLDQALLNMFADDINQLPDTERDKLATALRKQKSVLITSARPLPDAQTQQLQNILQSVLGQNITLETKVDEQLISGVRLTIGPMVLHANLADELEFFKAELHHAI
ncbi:MAG: hypothetical protein CMK89_20025 [Pseudomonadales bacterium]|nr:hypothetical protein [Pseudomonadales bacterium]